MISSVFIQLSKNGRSAHYGGLARPDNTHETLPKVAETDYRTLITSSGQIGHFASIHCLECVVDAFLTIDYPALLLTDYTITFITIPITCLGGRQVQGFVVVSICVMLCVSICWTAPPATCCVWPGASSSFAVRFFNFLAFNLSMTRYPVVIAI